MKAKTASLDTRRYLAAGLAVLIFTAFVLLGLTGCSDNPVDPAISVQTINSTQESASSAPNFASYRGKDSYRCGEGSGWVTPERGGEIQLGWGNKHNKLLVGPGSVEEPVFIQISSCPLVNNSKTDDFEPFEFEFSPDNLTFLRPAKLQIITRELNSLHSSNGYLKLWYFNPDMEAWELAQQAKIIRGRVTFMIDHFSKYGISK